MWQAIKSNERLWLLFTPVDKICTSLERKIGFGHVDMVYKCKFLLLKNKNKKTPSDPSPQGALKAIFGLRKS